MKGKKIKMNQPSTLSTRTASGHDVIVVDIPWSCTPEVNNDDEKRTESNSPTNVFESLVSIPVKTISKQDSALFIWVRFPFISNAYHVIQAWGFTYRACAFVWHKEISKKIGSKIISNYKHPNENNLCLLATRGKMELHVQEIAELINSNSPVRGNAQKPYEQYERIERLYPGARYLDLFIDPKRKGWDVWSKNILKTLE